MEMSDITILLVEDDQNVRATVKSMLMEMSITQIYEAADGQAALNYFDNDPEGINLVICDWNMPHKTGIEFLREIRQSAPDLPFLMITARADADSVLAAKEAYVTAYIRKPFSFEDIRSKVLSVIRRGEGGE